MESCEPLFSTRARLYRTALGGCVPVRGRALCMVREASFDLTDGELDGEAASVVPEEGTGLDQSAVQQPRGVLRSGRVLLPAITPTPKTTPVMGGTATTGSEARADAASVAHEPYESEADGRAPDASPQSAMAAVERRVAALERENAMLRAEGGASGSGGRCAPRGDRRGAANTCWRPVGAMSGRWRCSTCRRPGRTRRPATRRHRELAAGGRERATGGDAAIQ